MKNNSDKFLLAFAVFVILIALVNLGITFYKFGGLERLTGYATDTGTANLSIVSAASINFTNENINWGTGRVNESAGFATLTTDPGNVSNGNWTNVSQGLTIRNDGNCNVQLNLTTSNFAATFIGGTNPVYQLKVTVNETGSCSNATASSYLNATGASQPGCYNFTYYDNNDTLDIDVNITVPQDALPGPKGSIITATATVID